jgi:hypothetical protein
MLVKSPVAGTFNVKTDIRYISVKPGQTTPKRTFRGKPGEIGHFGTNGAFRARAGKKPLYERVKYCATVFSKWPFTKGSNIGLGLFTT